MTSSELFRADSRFTGQPRPRAELEGSVIIVRNVEKSPYHTTSNPRFRQARRQKHTLFSVFVLSTPPNNNDYQIKAYVGRIIRETRRGVWSAIIGSDTVRGKQHITPHMVVGVGGGNRETGTV